MQLAEGCGQTVEAPQVDPRLRLIKNHDRRVFRKDRRDLDPLDLAAGQRRVHLAVQIIAGTKAHLREIVAALVAGQLLFRRHLQQIAHRQSLEARRLLEGVGNACLGALCDVKGRDVHAVEADLSGVRGDDAHDDAGKGGFAAAVRSGDDDVSAVRDVEGDVVEYLFPLSVRLRYAVGDVFQSEHRSLLFAVRFSLPIL